MDEYAGQLAAQKVNTGEKRILVLAAETRAALASIRSLGNAGYKIYTGCQYKWALGGFSRYCDRVLVYPTNRAKFREWLLQVVSDHRIQIVLPTNDPALRLVVPLISELEEHGVVLPLPSAKACETALDKVETLNVARSLGIPVPPTVAIRSWEELDAVIDNLNLNAPFVIKPRPAGGRTAYARDINELTGVLGAWDRAHPPPIIQEFVEGEGRGAFFLYGPDGQCQVHFAHRRLRDLYPTGSASVLSESVELDEGLRKHAQRLLEEIGWRGVAMVEFRVSPDGTPYLMEINGRLWGSLQLAIDAGVDFPRLLIESFSGQPIQSPKSVNGVRLRWFLGDCLNLMRVLAGPPKGFPGAFPRRLSALRAFLSTNARSEIWRRDDPLPALAELLAHVRRKSSQ